MSEGDVVVKSSVSAPRLVLDFLKSSVGAKVIMGLTGLVLWGFVIGHLLGNLQQLISREAINDYAHTLKTTLPLLWGTRIVVGGAVLVHIWMGLRLAAKNRAARPVGYARAKRTPLTLAGASMALTGLLILAFIVFHLAHFTLGWVLPDAFALVNEEGHQDVFTMVWIAFKKPWVVAIYLVGQTLLLAHLIHGTASLWQSFGIYHPVWSPVLRVGGRTLAVLIFLGNFAIPLSIFFLWDNR